MLGQRLSYFMQLAHSAPLGQSLLAVARRWPEVFTAGVPAAPIRPKTKMRIMSDVARLRVHLLPYVWRFRR
jgi:hypothetical protein